MKLISHLNCTCLVTSFRKQQEDDEVKIVAVDLQAMAPLPGVVQIQGDITKVFLNCNCCTNAIVRMLRLS